MRFRTDIQAMNRVVEKMRFNIVGGYSNMLGGGNLAVNLAVQKSMSLKYEPSSEPLHIFVKQLFSY